MSSAAHRCINTSITCAYANQTRAHAHSPTHSYYKEVKAKQDAELIVMDSDACIFTDEGFRPWAEKYAADEAAFFSDYAGEFCLIALTCPAAQMNGVYGCSD